VAGGGLGKDPHHWLHRLDEAEWLAAAEVELGHAAAALDRRAVRPAVVHARRAAGMALNALLCREERPAWGRSYMEHVTALCEDATVSEEVRAAARQLRDTPAAPPSLVKLGAPDRDVHRAAALLCDWARRQLS
jgi:HEPN domain-containing protein